MTVAIVDYGSGNLRSAAKAFERVAAAGLAIQVTSDPDTVRRILDLVDRNEYKRRQAPPGPKITSKAFGKDRRLPITNRYPAHRARSARPKV